VLVLEIVLDLYRERLQLRKVQGIGRDCSKGLLQRGRHGWLGACKGRHGVCVRVMLAGYWWLQCLVCFEVRVFREGAKIKSSKPRH
jgi:hypothetical protein